MSLYRFMCKSKYRALFLQISIVAILSVSVYAAGELDPSFNAAANGSGNGIIYTVQKQSDGKILVGGLFSDVNGVAANSIARLNSDGSIDSSFNTQNLFNALGTGPTINTINVQANGKILVGGYFYSTSFAPQPGLRRLNSDGSLDSTFTTFTIFGGDIFDIAIQTDGKIIIGGEFTGPNSSQNIARLNSNGSVDTSFSSVSGITVRKIQIQNDGKLIIGGNLTGNTAAGFIKRLAADGSIDNTFASFSSDGGVRALKLKSGGEIIVGGTFTTVNGFSQGRISMLNPDGSLDLSFNQNNSGLNGVSGVGVYDIETRKDGKVLIGGRFLTFNGVSRHDIALLNVDGTLDTSFQDNSVLLNSATVYGLEILSDGKIVVGTTFSDYPLSVRKFTADGVPETAFAPIFARLGAVRKILRQPDGKILISGDFPFANGVKRNSLARLNSDGSLDLSFVPYFVNDSLQKTIGAIAVQSDGKILIGELFQDQVLRLNPDGTKDMSFTAPFFGATNDIVVLATGKILVGGTFGIKRLNSDGSNDSAFNTAAASVNTILVQSDGKILISGNFTTVNGTGRGRIARLNADGSLDTTFNPPGGANGMIYDMDLQADGKVVVGGSFTSLNGSVRMRVGRLLADGFLDNSFFQDTDNIVRAVKIQPDGKILIGGSFAFVQSQLNIGLARLNSNGIVDSSFTAVPNTSVHEITLQPDNKVLIGGEFILVNGASAVRIARLQNNLAPAKTMFDYDGDGKADVSVFRPSELRWYTFLSGSSTVSEQIFGAPGDLLAPADYDGDGKTDIGVFRPSTGDWWYRSSLNGAQVQNHWGTAGDIPRPGDFDGDGKADLVVFRPSENTWYRYGSTGAVSILNFGLAGDKPVLGDFDGDGKSDIAIYRPSTGVWWYQSSINNSQNAVQWGVSTDIPAPADYDGDGKTDFAVYRASTGVWYIVNSSNQSYSIGKFGVAEDKPVPADYDGDGKADLAVYRPSQGVWYLLKSTAGFSGVQFGLSTDVPTPNSFVP